MYGKEIKGKKSFAKHINRFRFAAAKSKLVCKREERRAIKTLRKGSIKRACINNKPLFVIVLKVFKKIVQRVIHTAVIYFVRSGVKETGSFRQGLGRLFSYISRMILRFLSIGNLFVC